MTKKVFKLLAVLMVICGIAVSFVNFSVDLSAEGTTPVLEENNPEYWWLFPMPLFKEDADGIWTYHEGFGEWVCWYKTSVNC